jgi:AraC-like DNA-binding protein
VTINEVPGLPAPTVARRERSRRDFAEAPAWASIGNGWRRLHGDFRNLGYSIEWHDFVAKEDLEWSRSFHPGSVEICLNLAGNGEVSTESSGLSFGPNSTGFYLQQESGLRGIRRGGDRHQFITIELSRDFARQHLDRNEAGLHPTLAIFIGEKPTNAAVSENVPLSNDHRALIMSLRKPPVFAAAQRLWYHGKALEVASTLFYQTPPSGELFCERQKKLNRERVQRVMSLLKENLAEPQGLEEIARRVGCSPFYLSRIFTQEVGQTMTQFLRQARMERAAQLLVAGQLKITAIALEVGYSSPSHFSAAFHETYGCCPGLYPLRTQAQKDAI